MKLATVMKRAVGILVLLAAGFCSTGLFAEDVSAEARSAILSGADLERSQKWLDAIEHYEKALKGWPENKSLQYGLRRSKIHFGIERRYADSSFENQLLRMPKPQALDRYERILAQVQGNYVEPVSSTSFVAHGTESLYLALNNPKFIDRHLRNAAPDRVRRLRMTLRDNYWNKPVANRTAASAMVDEVCELAWNEVRLGSGPVIMEYLFGGCNALDDYSSYLTPDRLNDLYGNIEGEFVGLGIEMKAEAGRGMLLVNVLPESPAQEGGLRRGDYIVAVENRDCRNMTTDEAAKLLRGPSGSLVQIEVKSPGRDETRKGRFARRAVQVKSIPVAKIIDSRSGVGYIQMTGFQKTTAAEMDAALARLQSQGMKSLIWDLRGNPGGLLTAAVEVLDRFVASGVLVSTKGRIQDQNWSYSARPQGTSNVPLVLLVDADSASASEIVAGAVLDHNRGTIVGRQTYGKWSVQSIFPVQGSTGLRLTTAKFYSPRGNTYGKVGVKPHVFVDRPEREYTVFYGGTTEEELTQDADIIKGLEVLKRQAAR
jgi:carboxyl-terminal processing protease